jgi:hypothetical protein
MRVFVYQHLMSLSQGSGHFLCLAHLGHISSEPASLVDGIRSKSACFETLVGVVDFILVYITPTEDHKVQIWRLR